jgi:hypothetical protein
MVGRERCEGVAGGRDDLLEERTAEVKASNDGMDAVLRGELSHVADDVDDARMAAAGQDDEAPSAHGRDKGLVVESARVRLPPSLPVGLVEGEALLELGRAVDLAGDQERAVEEKRGPAFLDDLEAGSLECGPAGGGQLDRIATWQGEPAVDSRTQGGSARAGWRDRAPGRGRRSRWCGPSGRG